MKMLKLISHTLTIGSSFWIILFNNPYFNEHRITYICIFIIGVALGSLFGKSFIDVDNLPKGNNES